MPLRLDPKVERSLWRLADALAKALRTPDAGNPGDPQWRVEALASRAWKITHPDLPIVKDSEGAGKDVLLQFHVQQDPTSQKWFVVAQNKVVGPDTHASPQALIVAKEDEPPNERWDFESIGQAAANFFKKQKNDLVERAQAMMPPAQPGANEAPKQDDQGGGGGPPGGPMASYYRRRARLARRLNDPFDSGVQSSLAAGPQNTSRSATLITLEHLADTLDQKVKDLDTGSLSVSMVPTSGGQLLVQIFGTYQDYLREGKSLPSLLDKLVVKTSEELGVVLSPDADWKTYPNFRTKKTQPSGYTILGFRPWRMSHTREASSDSNGIPRTHPLSKMGRYIRGKFGRFEQIAPHVSLDAWYDPGYNPTTDKQDPKEATLNVTFTVNHKVFSQQKDKLEEFKRHANRIIDEAAQRYGVTVKGSRWTPDWNMRSKEEFLYYTYKKVLKLDTTNRQSARAAALITFDDIKRIQDKVPPCPKCQSQKTTHVRSMHGNTQCTDCGHTYQDPHYGRKASVNLPRVLASDELYEELNQAARPFKRVVYTQTIPEVYSDEDHDYEDKDIHTLLVSFQPKNAEEDQKLVALLNPILRDFADKTGGYLLKRWYPDRYSNLYRINIHFPNYHAMGQARDQALDIIKEVTPHLKGHVSFTGGTSVSWGPANRLSLRLENHNPRDVIPDRKIIDEALSRYSVISGKWRGNFNPRSQAERLPHDPITSFYDLQFAKPPTQRQSRFQRLADRLLLLTDENRRKLEALTRKLKDQDLKADADFLQNQLLDWKNTLAEAPGTIRRNRTGTNSQKRK
jgi:ribosomal protein L37AE/L43A